MAQVYVPKNTFADSGAAIEEADGDPRFSQGGQGPRQNHHELGAPPTRRPAPLLLLAEARMLQEGGMSRRYG